MKDTRGQRGKWAEGEVDKWLKKANREIARFASLKLPDARAAMGRMKAMPSDLIVFSPAGATFLEVKEIEHDFRVPHANIKQLAELKKFQLAGCRACVLIYFKANTNKWRCIDASELESISRGSWDLREHPLFDTPEQAFTSKYTWD